MHRHVVSGRHITDVPSLCRAFERAAEAAEGSWGTTPYCFDDRLFGGFGLEHPCGVIWEGAEATLLDIHIQAPGDTFVSVDLGPQMVIHAIQIADLDDDGDGDIVVLGDDTNLEVTTLTVLLQDIVGDEPMFASQSYGVDCGATTLAIGRIDGDAAPDLVVGSPASITVMIRRNDGAGGFSTSTHAILDLGVDQLHVFDFSGDGFADIVGASSTTGMVTLALNQP